MPDVEKLLSEMEAWRQPGNWCTPKEFAAILARPDTEFSLANQELLRGPEGGFLLEIIQTLYYVSHETDEGRTLSFNLVYRSLYSEDLAEQWGIEGSFNTDFRYWRFAESLPFSLQEIRRLAVCNPDTSAIWVEIPGDRRDPQQLGQARLEIRGLAQLGQKWMDSVQSLSYEYANRETPLIFRVAGPGWIEVYNGSRFYARLKAGQPQIALPRDIKDKNVLNYLVKDGLKLLKGPIKAALPELAEINPRDAIYFAEYSYYSVVLAIINSIQRLNHGGALILTSMSQKQATLNHLKLKYPFQADEHMLKGLYLEFIASMSHGLAMRQARGRDLSDQQRRELEERIKRDPGLRARAEGVGGLMRRQQIKQPDLPPEKLAEMEIFYHRVNQAHKNLVECCQLVGGFSSADGAIVLDTSLDTLGFSAEILLETLDAASSQQVIHKISGHLLADRQLETEVLDLKHTGMRHRSAAKLCAAIENIAVFVVSQDGGVSLIWNKSGEVFFWEDFRTKNMPFDLIPTLFDAEREVFGDTSPFLFKPESSSFASLDPQAVEES